MNTLFTHQHGEGQLFSADGSLIAPVRYSITNGAGYIRSLSETSLADWDAQTVVLELATKHPIEIRIRIRTANTDPATPCPVVVDDWYPRRK